MTLLTTHEGQLDGPIRCLTRGNPPLQCVTQISNISWGALWRTAKSPQRPRMEHRHVVTFSCRCLCATATDLLGAVSVYLLDMPENEHLLALVDPTCSIVWRGILRLGFQIWVFRIKLILYFIPISLLFFRYANHGYQLYHVIEKFLGKEPSFKNCSCGASMA